MEEDNADEYWGDRFHCSVPYGNGALLFRPLADTGVPIAQRDLIWGETSFIFGYNRTECHCYCCYYISKN